jgi:FkbM family methyltransferase
MDPQHFPARMAQIVKHSLPSPLRSLYWRWLLGTEAFAEQPIRSSARLALWSFRELRQNDICFRTKSGVKICSMPKNLSALALYLEGTRDPWMQRFIERRIGPHETFVDVGANIGAYSLNVAKHAGVIYAFEAQPKIYKYLLGNIVANSLTNIQAFNFAIGSGEGSISVQYMADNPGESFVTTHTYRKSTPVAMHSLDGIMATIGCDRIDYLKIDVEGFEFNVILGAIKAIITNSDIVVQTEHVERHARRYGQSNLVTINYLRAHGLSPYRVNSQGLLKLITENEFEGDVIWTRALAARPYLE